MWGHMIPFEEILIHFCDKLSQALFAESQRPELVALAFWLRRSHIEELRDRFNSLQRVDEILVPRGLAFHIAPANVETLFVYSWILSMLVGNANVVRLPSRKSEATTLLFDLLKKLLEQEEFKKVGQTTTLLSYGHEEEITSSISKKSDVRLIWGGDETIETIRKIPLKVNGKELVFPDRYSFALFGSEPDPALFFRDLFLYDQRTCASPRAAFWLGAGNLNFYKKVEEIAREHAYELPLSARLNKLAKLYEVALDLPILEIQHFGPLTVVKQEKFDPICRHFGGDGLLFHIEIESIDQMAEVVIQKDQTLIHAGVAEEELATLARKLNGKGLDRMVPVGSALHFSEVWDGYDLLAELSKRVSVHA